MTTSDVPRPRLLPRILTILASLAAAAAPLWYGHHERLHGVWLGFAASYSLMLALAGGLSLSRSTGAQLFSRSVWWSAFGAGILAAVFAAEQRAVAATGLAIALGTAASLVLTGRRGLDQERGFAPAAYRGPILVSMIMALADAQGLGWIGASRLYSSLQPWHESIDVTEVKQASAMLVCAGVALIALYGLYKLRLWGLVLSAMTTLSIGVLSWTSVTGMADAGPLPYAFSISAAIQIALLVPLLVAIARGRAPSPASPRASRIGRIAPSVVVVLMAAVAIVTVATSHSLVRF